jgi:DNA polymerase
MVIPISIDFETRSACNIQKAGAHRYAEDPTTSVLCLAVKPKKHAPKIWVPEWLRERLAAVLLREWDEWYRTHGLSLQDVCEATGGGVYDIMRAQYISAFNAGFEQAVWEKQMETKFGAPPLPLEKLRCTAARSAMCSLPRTLDQIGKALDLPMQKDGDGHRVMMKLCKPRAARKAERAEMIERGLEQVDTKTWFNPATGENVYLWHEPEDCPHDYIKLFEYCMQDTATEEALDAAVPHMPAQELELWQLDQKINRRGVCVDLDLVDSMLGLISRTEERLVTELRELTGGEVQTGKQVDKIKTWLGSQGVDLYSLTKDVVKKALAGDLPPKARRFLEIRQTLSKASTAKYNSIKAMVCADGRIRDLFRYHGAGTGRWAGKGLQVQNLPRGHFGDYETAIAVAAAGDDELLEMFYQDLLGVASTLIRPALIAGEGCDLVCSDYSSIEGRGLAWSAGENHVLDHYNHNRDMYIVAATTVFGGTYEELYAEYKEKGDKRKRTVGKPTELGLGYGGGIGAFSSMAEVYGIDLETLPAIVFPLASDRESEFADRMAKTYLTTCENNAKKKGEPYIPPMSHEAAMACDIIKQKWRADRPATVEHWKRMEYAAAKAVQNPGRVFTAGRSRFCVKGGYLKMLLASGRMLYYYNPRMSQKKTSWGEKKWCVTYMGLDHTARWVRQHTYGGKLVENETQALARDILAHAMPKLEAAGYPIVLHVHDEAVAEVVKARGTVEEFEAIMAELPPWAEGFPLKASGGWRGLRFRKD